MEWLIPTVVFLIQLPCIIHSANLSSSTYKYTIPNDEDKTIKTGDDPIEYQAETSTNYYNEFAKEIETSTNYYNEFAKEIETSTNYLNLDFTNDNAQRLCAFMNVTHNSSYDIFDREDFSVGLSKIHNSSDIFERFISVKIEENCEVTICELQILNSKGRVRKCFTLDKSQSLETISRKAPDPITSQYFVSTGCSCKTPAANCNYTQCKDVILEDHECGRLYKEPNCSECRYEVKSLNESESFIPSNTFWCQSYVIRDGCRISIDTVDGSGMSNVRNYTDRTNYVEMDYVRYPNPSSFSCICDLEPKKNSSDIHDGKSYAIRWILPLCLCIGITLLSALSAVVLRKYGILKLKKNLPPDPGIDYVIKKFQYGNAHKDIQTQTLTEQGYTYSNVTNYVSVGFLTALEQPYQPKWEISRDKIKIDNNYKVLGMGQFGKVCLGKVTLSENEETDAAIKSAKVSMNMNYFISILDEIKILAFIGKHPNICSLIGACTQNIKQREALIVLELCSNGNLKNYLTNNKHSFLEAKNNNDITIKTNSCGYTAFASIQTNDFNLQIKPSCLSTLIKWCEQIACGMEFLSLKQVIHIDLAARNILLTDSLECKIGDFGLSQRLHEVMNYVRIGNEYPLPFRWISLESLLELKFTIQSDVWSYGVTLFEMFSLGEDPYPTICSIAALVQTLTNGERLHKPNHCSNEIYDIMLKCWEADPERRPTFSDLKLHFEALHLSAQET